MRRAIENSELSGDNRSDNSVDAQIRNRVQNRMMARSSFYAYLLGIAVVNAMLWGIWATSSRGFPWPVFITLPSLVGLMAQGWRVYQYSPDAAAQHDEEVEREVDAEKRRMGIV